MLADLCRLVSDKFKNILKEKSEQLSVIQQETTQERNPVCYKVQFLNSVQSEQSLHTNQ